MNSKSFILFLVVLFSVMLVSNVDSAIKNLLNNPNFENGVEGWSFGADYGSISVDTKEKAPVGGVLYTKVDKLGANAWEPEIHSPDFPLDLDKTYTMDFFAKTEPGKTRNLMIKFEQLDKWGGPSGVITINDQWKQYNLTAKSDFQSPPNSVIHIQFEGSVDDVWFHSFRVYEGEFAPTVLSPVSPVGRLATAWGEIKR